VRDWVTDEMIEYQEENAELLETQRREMESWEMENKLKGGEGRINEGRNKNSST
jgi:hypothetical protein